MQSEIERETWRPPSALAAETFGAYATAWLAQRRTRTGDPLRPRTVEMYRDAVSRGLAQFAEVRLLDVSAAMVRSWHAARVEESGASQAGLETRILRAIMRTASRDGVIPSNPVPSELAATRTGREHRPPTPEELATIIDAVPRRYRLAVQLAAFGGLRLGEWRALRRSDLTLGKSGNYVVNVSKQALRVDGAWIVTDPKSDTGIRSVALPVWLTDDVSAHLRDHVGRFPESLLFETGGKGEYVDMGWRRAWDKARDAAGVRAVVREHDLRHFYGTQLAESGATAMQLKSAMGHAAIATSMLYVNAAKGAPAHVADLLQPLPSPSETNLTQLKRTTP